MGTGETQPTGDFRLPMGSHMAAQLLFQYRNLCHHICYGGYRLVSNFQPLFSPGAFRMIDSGIFCQPFYIPCPIVDQDGSALYQPLTEFRQGAQ